MTPKEKLIVVMVIVSLILAAVSLAVSLLSMREVPVVSRTIYEPAGGAGSISLVIEGGYVPSGAEG